MDRPLIQLGLLGGDLSRTQSPSIHQAIADTLGYDLSYYLYAFDNLSSLGHLQGRGCTECSENPGSKGDFSSFLDDLQSKGLVGLSVTNPFKETICQYLDVLTPEAEIAGAVNTVKFLKNGQRIGHNTDGIGFVQHLETLGWNLKGKHVVLLGAGGAARGILFALIAQQPGSVVVVNRSAGRAEALVKLGQKLSSNFAVNPASFIVNPASEPGSIQQDMKVTLGDIQSAVSWTSDQVRGDNWGDPGDRASKVIIQATSVSGQMAARPEIQAMLEHARYAYDLAYGDTAFCQQAEQCGVPNVADGLGMLNAQAQAAWALWMKP